jgi:hypothetical protein
MAVIVQLAAPCIQLTNTKTSRNSGRSSMLFQLGIAEAWGVKKFILATQEKRCIFKTITKDIRKKLTKVKSASSAAM